MSARALKKKAEALHEQAMQHLRGRVYDKALHSFDQLVALVPTHAQAHYQRGNILFDLGRPEQALIAYREALKNRRAAPDVLNAIANCHYALGEKDAAISHYEQVFVRQPGNVHCLYNLAQIGRLSPDSAPVKQLRALYDSPASSGDDRVRVCFALAKVTEGQGDVAAAFPYYAEANRLKHALLKYDPAADLAFIDAIENTFTGELFRRLQGVGNADETPIFVLGMPRSGTTLVEQILASHSTVHGTGEVDLLPAIPMRMIPQATGAPFPQNIERLTKEHYQRFAAQYLAQLKSYGPPGKTRIVDKTLTNYLYAGLIHLMLPRARIIHCVRDPMDTCWSLFRHHFAGSHRYCYDQASLAAIYCRYRKLMQHWHHVLPPGAMHDVHYEQLVENPEPTARALLAHAGLPWEEGCLQFHDTKRAVLTASALQVRQPIYKSAIKSWTPVAGELAVLRAALASD